GLSPAGELRWMWLANITAIRLWDEDHWDALSERYVRLARESGALSELPLALTVRAFSLLFAGDLAAAASLVDELRAVKEATGVGLAPYSALTLAALRGDEASAAALVEATLQDVARRGEGIGVTFAEWANALLRNGLGQYDKAMAAGLRATEYDRDLAGLTYSLIELIEAAVRCGTARAANAAVAAKAYGQLTEMAEASATEWLLAAHARCGALLAEGEDAERLYRESIARFGKTRLRVDLARAHLLYGEWLRRERRRNEAREHLRTAHNMLERMGVAAFAERAARELRATGETARKRDGVAYSAELTAQEAQIARLARDGLSNPEIGTRLFISAHTVQYHLRKVFTKLGITSRSQLDRVLPGEPSPVAHRP
ncbi:MAG: helix-turn-helix transcriptional regulator, partial [Actinocrinis sp.]